MGLDQYLYKRTSLNVSDFFKPEQRHEVLIMQNGVETNIIQKDRISSITELVFTWRKFNALEGYMMKYHNESVEIGQKNIYLYKEDFVRLLDVAKKVEESLAKSTKKVIQEEVGWSKQKGKLYEDVEVYNDIDVVKELFPPEEGFFFGSNEIDDYYRENVQGLIQEIQSVLDEMKKDEENKLWTTWYYTSWW